MKQRILELITSKPKHFSKIIKKDFELLNWVNENTKIISSNFSETVYSAIHGTDNICYLGNVKKFNSINEGYRFCGSANKCKCAAKSVADKVSVSKNLYTIEKKATINQKRLKTTLAKYGVTNNGQTTTAKNNHANYYASIPRKEKKVKLTAFQKLNIKFKNLCKVEFTIFESQYLGVSNQIYYKFKCLVCNNNFDDYIDNGHLPKCKICHPYIPVYTSNQETEIYNYIKTICEDEVQQSNRNIINPYELDIVIPRLKIAVEYCGLYWHSEANKLDNNYHLNKLQLCNLKGYRLVTIFEDEWTETPDIVKNRLKSILGKDSKIFARKCIVKRIPMTLAKDFIQQNHIQGNAIAKLAYGCYYNNKLVAVMTFGKPRYDKTADYELIRYCSVGTIVGGAGKLFSAFLKEHQPKKVISYCDMRWGTGNLYAKLNFIQSPNKLKSSYWYTDFIKRYHRSKFTKKTIVKSQEDNEKTEYVLMREKNMYRIWDCGQTKWIYTHNKN